MRLMLLIISASFLGVAAPSAAQQASVAQRDCAGLLTRECLETLGAGVTPAAGGDCDRRLSDYRACLADLAASSVPGGSPGLGACDATLAKDLWDIAAADNDCLGYQAFLDSCPDAPRANFARARLQRLNCPAAPTPAPEEAAGGAVDPPPEAAAAQLLRDGQTELKRLGLYAGPIDGDWGPASRRAMRSAQTALGVTADGALTPALLEQLRQATLEAVSGRRAPETGAGADSAADPASRASFETSVGDRVFFEAGQADLTDSARRVLDRQIQWLSQRPDTRVTVAGHADDPGGREDNFALSARRAAVVVQYLLANGVPRDRVQSLSYGRERPAEGCDGAACQAANRRVVLRVE